MRSTHALVLGGSLVATAAAALLLLTEEGIAPVAAAPSAPVDAPSAPASLPGPAPGDVATRPAAADLAASRSASLVLASRPAVVGLHTSRPRTQADFDAAVGHYWLREATPPLDAKRWRAISIGARRRMDEVLTQFWEARRPLDRLYHDRIGELAEAARACGRVDTYAASDPTWQAKARSRRRDEMQSIHQGDGFIKVFRLYPGGDGEIDLVRTAMRAMGRALEDEMVLLLALDEARRAR